MAAEQDRPWRPLMPAVRAGAVALAKQGRLVITRKGKPVDPDAFKGVYRLKIPEGPAVDAGAQAVGPTP